jgi:hypothetical protein
LNGDAGNPVEAAIPPFDLYGGVRWAWIQYAKRSKRLKVFVDDDSTKPGSPLLNERLPLRPALGRKTRAGFTAATGGENAVMDVLSWRLKQKRPRN